MSSQPDLLKIERSILLSFSGDEYCDWAAIFSSKLCLFFGPSGKGEKLIDSDTISAERIRRSACWLLDLLLIVGFLLLVTKVLFVFDFSLNPFIWKKLILASASPSCWLNLLDALLPWCFEWSVMLLYVDALLDFNISWRNLSISDLFNELFWSLLINFERIEVKYFFWCSLWERIKVRCYKNKDSYQYFCFDVTSFTSSLMDAFPFGLFPLAFPILWSR